MVQIYYSSHSHIELALNMSQHTPTHPSILKNIYMKNVSDVNLLKYTLQISS